MSVGHRAPRVLRTRSLRVGVVSALAVLAAAIGDVALAQTLDPATVAVSDFGPVVLDGSPASTTATMSDFTVTDASGDGWHVMVQATQFAEVNEPGEYV